jgi:hypothetical protein
MLIDAAIPGDRNLIKIEGEISNCEDFITEIQHMRNVKANVIAVIVEVTGTILKSPRQYLSNIPGKHEIKEVQQTAILGTAHLLQ